MKKVAALALLIATLSGCVHPQVKFRKARLLDPMMDPAKTDGLHTTLRNEPGVWNERGTGDVGGSLGGSCPTCGT